MAVLLAQNAALQEQVNTSGKGGSELVAVQGMVMGDNSPMMIGGGGLGNDTLEG
jgi:hypothetical protein